MIYTGKIKSLFREKNEAKEVKAGLECGIGLRDFNDIKKNDILETFKLVNVDEFDYDISTKRSAVYAKTIKG